MRGYWKLGTCALVGLLVCSVATAQFRTDFEDPPYTGTPAGTILTGQGPGAGFYIPAATTSTDYLCYDYAGNTLLIPNHPIDGGDQFVAGTGPGGGTYARAQLDITWGKGKWTAWYDFLAHCPATLAYNNIGSFSTQLYPGEATYIHLFSWQDTAIPGNPALGFKAYYMGYDALGVAHAQPGMSPGPEWESLPLDNWYRAMTTIDYDANQIIAVSIIDLHTGKAASFEPTDWYLEGGSAGGLPIPTGFRFFAGGGTAIDNSVAWDNTCISAGVGIGDLDCSGKVDFGDIDPFVLALSGAAGYYAMYPDCCYQNADCNLDGVVDFGDIDAFVALLSGP